MRLRKLFPLEGTGRRRNAPSFATNQSFRESKEPPPRVFSFRKLRLKYT